jgi:hypothetical protein
VLNPKPDPDPADFKSRIRTKILWIRKSALLPSVFMHSIHSSTCLRLNSWYWSCCWRGNGQGNKRMAAFYKGGALPPSTCTLVERGQRTWRIKEKTRRTSKKCSMWSFQEKKIWQHVFMITLSCYHGRVIMLSCYHDRVIMLSW